MCYTETNFPLNPNLNRKIVSCNGLQDRFHKQTFYELKEQMILEKLKIAFQHTTAYSPCWLNNGLFYLINTPCAKPWDVIDLFHNPRMHLFHIPQCYIQNRNVHISVLGLWRRIHVYPRSSYSMLVKRGPERQTLDEEPTRSLVRKSLLTNMVLNINYALYSNGNIKWFCHSAMIYSKRVLLNGTRGAVPITIA